MKQSNSSEITKLTILVAGAMTISLPVIAESGKGMTWGYRGQTIPNGPANLVQVGCNSGTQWAPGQTMCNAYKGETSCTEQRHILCAEEAGNIPRPAYAVNPGKEQSTGWYPGRIKLGPKVRGTQLANIATANDFCGTGWRIAEFHDGHWIRGMNAQNHHASSNPAWNLSNASKSGGWNLNASFAGNNDALNKLKAERFWVNIKNQKANCWNYKTTTPPQIPQPDRVITCAVNPHYTIFMWNNPNFDDTYYRWSKPYPQGGLQWVITKEDYYMNCPEIEVNDPSEGADLKD